ncbi:MAG: hypothetical protein JJE39_11725 [Vicinamibacteria bacterium]|nr:hypothetical protein [Vicinamibacteria bacterium]
MPSETGGDTLERPLDRVVEAALLERFGRLPEPWRSEVAALPREDDPVSRLRADLEPG